MATLCDICGVRPATMRATVVRHGQRETLNLCEFDYRRLARQQGFSSPLESLFGSGRNPLDEFLDDDFWGEQPVGVHRIPIRSGRGRRTTANTDERLSEHAKQMLQQAARAASEFGRPEVDTEHLLLALTDSEVVRTILDHFKISADDLRAQIEREASRGEHQEEGAEIGVSPRLKNALGRAFTASRELGHSYIGPEHLLVGLAEEDEGMAGDMLRRYGLTPEALRQQIVKVVGRGAEEGRVERPTNTPDLDKYARDLTALARQGKLDPVIGRAREIETTIEVLARRKKNNPRADRGARRRQDGHCGRSRAAHCVGRSAGGVA